MSGKLIDQMVDELKDIKVIWALVCKKDGLLQNNSSYIARYLLLMAYVAFLAQKFQIVIS